MKYIILIVLAWGSIFNQAGRELYASKNVKTSLYSKAPIEDIQGNSTTGSSVFDATTGELDFSILIRSFHFDKSLMEEHFNEDYMESDKYPKAIFSGKIKEHVDVSKDGKFPVTVTGELEVHGVKQERTVAGIITINNGAISMTSEFMVKCADHQIKIPTLVFKHIAESIQIKLAATYTKVK